MSPAGVACTFILALFHSWTLSGSSPSQGVERRSVAGLAGEVDILRDRWGISHIYARSEADLFFAQGYGAARDRLFQMELWRRQATGTTAEILGKRELKRDIATRLFKFRGDLSQELSHYHPRGESIVASFVAGINAYILETERNPGLLPIEFRLLGITPGRWTPEVVISRHQGLLANASEEIDVARAVHLLGAEKVRELSWFRPGDPVIELDPAIDPSLLKEEILDLYRIYRSGIRFQSGDIVGGDRGVGGIRQFLAAGMPVELALARQGEDIGSNNWVVAGSRTLTGFPIMANDPHRAQMAPSLRYWVHLVAPGWNVIGGGEPVLPGVSIGHNEHGAWGLTVFGQDSEDIYVYDTHASDPLQYRYRDGWETMRVLRETIPVKGEADFTAELKYTRHGPVIFEDAARHKAYALRAAWLDIGSAPYLASLRMDQAANWDEFRAACSYSRIPAENMVWADTAKNIGYQAVGVSPVRPNWSGLVPVPGDGRYEWDGYLPIKALPHALNPEKGYIRTANNYMVPDGYAYPQALHFSWGDEMRAVRIDEVLGSGTMQTVADMMRLQHDELSIPARNLVPFLRGLDFDDARVRKARDLLLDWDFILDRDSVPAAVYASWERRLQANLLAVKVPENAREVVGRLNLKRTIDWIAAPDGSFGPDPVAGRDGLLSRSLSEAVEDLTRRLGPDLSGWRYGQPKFKHALIRHPLSAAVPESMRSRLDVGPVPRGGYGSTVNSTGGGDNQVSGASFRIVADTENWDNSVGTNAPGQSGNPDNPHYRDLFELWAKGKYFPVFFSKVKIESVTEERLLLGK